MTRDEIVQIAWDVGLLMRSHQFQDEPTKLERFAERIAAAEREACAKICDKTRCTGYVPAEDGEARAYYDAAAESCAEEIRARGET